MGVVPAPTLVSRWFERDRGKALGLALMQVLGLVAAPLAGQLVMMGGGHLLFLCLAGFFGALIPVMSQVIDTPETAGQSPRRWVADPLPPPVGAPPLSSLEIFTNRRFWLLSLAVGICTGLTALPVLGAVLREMDLLGSRIGQLALGIAGVNDAAIMMFLSVLLTAREGQLAGGSFGLATLSSGACRLKTSWVCQRSLALGQNCMRMLRIHA